MKKVMRIQEYVTGYEWIRGEDGYYRQTEPEVRVTSTRALVSEDVVDYFIKKAIEKRINNFGDAWDYYYDLEENSLMFMKGDDHLITNVVKYTYLIEETEIEVAA